MNIVVKLLMFSFIASVQLRPTNFTIQTIQALLELPSSRFSNYLSSNWDFLTKSIIDQKFDLNMASKKTDETLLHKCIKASCDVELLLSFGADPLKRNRYGENSLELAITHENPQKTHDLLITYGACLSRSRIKELLLELHHDETYIDQYIANYLALKKKRKEHIRNLKHEKKLMVKRNRENKSYYECLMVPIEYSNELNECDYKALKKIKKDSKNENN